MEASEEQQPGTLVRHILPPRLEDAGLEDCALPPDSIKQAFLKAAAAVKSRATSLFTDDDDEEDCVRDPWPSAEGRPDAVVGAETEGNPPGACGGDGVVVGREEEKRDKVVVGGEDVREVGGEKACVDGLVGLEIEEKKNEDKSDEGPILVGGYA
ncbi:hypothetical protein RchiOBHm_Chr2g0138661 [Rosa chinensis]|uniref:Uncharacterized protein n=1 Tax=Rosa chinensis TaxID=74649 RepID=A0A2P6RWW5_ROSCH|nr:uncharacterized protein LOC112184578 [Rosa chinensis]PRQ50930.1 hypothetical protein RchiOBHm_Chr2g0138661 [Rosa chinensis]